MNRSAGTSKIALGALGGVLALTLLGFAALTILDYVGWPWNLMRDQVTIQAQERPVLGPADGTVPYSSAAWSVESDPPPRTSRTIQDGARVYSNNCVFCHGAEGRGEGRVGSRMREAPQDLTSWKVQYRDDRDLFQWIAQPAAMMPPFEYRLEEEEIWTVLQYIQKSFRPTSPPPWIDSGDDALGERLYEALSCDQCHGPERRQTPAGGAPPLASVGSRLKKAWMTDYLLAPRRIRWRSEGVRPAIRMPAYSLTRREAGALTEFLALRVDRASFPEGLIDGPGTVEEGKAAFGTYQCRGCHTLHGEGNRIGPDLSDVGSRMQPDYLYQFLLDPQAVVPGTSMKNMDLWEDEARALVRYLQTLRVTAIP